MCWAETAATGCGLTNDYQVMKGQNLGYRGRVENSASAACSPFLLRTYMLPPSLPPSLCHGIAGEQRFYRLLPKAHLS